MTTVTAMPPVPARTAEAGAGAPRGVTWHPRTFFDGAGGGPTLDDMVSGAWEELTAHAVVECLVCDGELAPEYGSRARPIGRCRRCGSTLS